MSTLHGPLVRLMLSAANMSNVFWWLNLIKYDDQKEDIILLYIGYHNTPK